MKRRLAIVTIFVFLTLRAPYFALAHANLIRSSIKNGQVFKPGHTPKTVRSYFAEDLDPKGSWMAVFEGQADHGLVTRKERSRINFADPKEMTLSLPKLGREKYYLLWYTRSAVDGDIAAGVVYFQVK